MCWTVEPRAHSDSDSGDLEWSPRIGIFTAPKLTLLYMLHTLLIVLIPPRPKGGRRSLSEYSRTKGGGGYSHNSWKACIASLYLLCCQALCQHSINNNHHDNNSWNKCTEIKHRKSGATAGMCSSIMMWGRRAPQRPHRLFSLTTGQRASSPLTVMQMQDIP